MIFEAVSSLELGELALLNLECARVCLNNINSLRDAVSAVLADIVFIRVNLRRVLGAVRLCQKADGQRCLAIQGSHTRCVLISSQKMRWASVG